MLHACLNVKQLYCASLAIPYSCLKVSIKEWGIILQNCLDLVL